MRITRDRVGFGEHEMEKDMGKKVEHELGIFVFCIVLLWTQNPSLYLESCFV